MAIFFKTEFVRDKQEVIFFGEPLSEMSIVFQWDLKLIFCHIYEKTLITRIILGENNLISGTRRCASRTNTA